MNIELAKYIMRWNDTEYEYSKNDCMTFPMRWHDVRYGTAFTEKLAHKYNSARSALAFYRNFLSVEGWLRDKGYTSVDLEEPILDGDYVLTYRRGMPFVYISAGGHLYFRDEDKLNCYLPRSIQIDSVWRR